MGIKVWVGRAVRWLRDAEAAAEKHARDRRYAEGQAEFDRWFRENPNASMDEFGKAQRRFGIGLG